MTGLTKDYRTRPRVMRWSLAGAMAASLALFGGGYLASADTAVVPTPTVAPTTVATVAPTPAKVVTTVTNSASTPVRVRATGPRPCDGDCPITLGLKYENQDAPGADLRVGDTAKVTIVATNTGAATKTYGFSTYLDLNTADFQVLNADGTPASSGATSVFTLQGGATSAYSVIGSVNTFTIDGNGANGHLDLDANAILASLPTGAELGQGETDLASFRVRVRRNANSDSTLPTTLPPTPEPFEIRVLESNAGGTRNSVVSGGAEVEGDNLMSGRTTTASRNGLAHVVQTDVTITAADKRLTPGIGRVGDVIPVDVVLGSPTGGVRHINAVQASIRIATPSFRVVNANGDPIADGGHPFVQVIGNGNLQIGQAATGTFSAGNGSQATIGIDLTGSAPLVLQANGSAVVGRFYVQALLKTPETVSTSAADVSLDIQATQQVGERAPDGTVGFATRVIATPTAASPAQCVANVVCGQLGLGVVRGTTGVSLEVRSPMADNPAITAGSPTFVLATDTFHPFLGVQGRYVDVAVFVDAASSPTHNREANRFDIDIKYNQNLFGYETPQFVPSSGFTNRSGQGTSSGGTVSIRVDGTTPISSRTEIGRVRLALRDSRTTEPTAVSVWVAPSTATANPCATSGTRIWAEGSPICDIYAGSVVTSSTPNVGEFDKNAVVVNQPAATLQVAARLQGRRASDASTRFVQPIRIVLLRPGTTQAQVHQLTASGQAWNHQPVDTASTTFSFTTGTINAFENSPGTACDSGDFTLTAPSNIVLAKSYGPFACPINSIEPGTYDVYIKGQSSVGVLVKGVPFLPGQFRTLTGLTLREGDIEQGPNETDKVNIADFTAFSAAYNGYPTNGGQEASGNWNPKADLNQSGFIDILDFSLLASNYGTTSETQVDTIDRENGLSLSPAPSSMAKSATQTFTVKLDVGANTLRHAVVSVRPALNAYDETPANVCLGGDSVQAACPASTTPVRIPFDGTATGQVDLGQIKVSGVATGTATLIVRLEEADGTTGTPATRVFFKASDLVTSFDIVPDVTWDLRVAPVADHLNQFTAEVVLQPAMGTKITSGGASITFPVDAGYALTATCPANAVAGVTCSVGSGMIEYQISSPEGLSADANTGEIHLGMATLTAAPGVQASAAQSAITASVTARQSVAVTGSGVRRLSSDLQALVKNQTSGSVGTRAASTPIEVVITATRDLSADLAVLGATVGAHTPNHVHTARVPVGALVAAAEIPGVTLISTQPTYRPRLDQSVKALGVVNDSNARIPYATGTFDGAGTIVAVIDTGIDFTHTDFRNADGTTRIIAIWDQNTETSGTTAIDNPGTDRDAIHFARGVVCTRDDINAVLTGTAARCAHQDTNGHGTHVASIAAGTLGVAPKADIIVVRAIGAEASSVIEAFQWVVALAAQEGKPVSVNNSWGGHYGPHDGSDATSKAIDGYAQLSGVAMMVAAGNEGLKPLHTSGTSTASGAAIAFTPKGTSTQINVWYPSSATVAVTIKHAVASSETISKNQSATPQQLSDSGTNLGANLGANLSSISVDELSNCTTLYSSDQATNWCVIVVKLSNLTADQAEWSIELGGDATYHAWVVDEDGAAFDMPDYRVTIDEPAVARGAITVGAWTSKACWQTPTSGTNSSCNTGAATGSYARFSSLGPTSDGRLKPEVSAPGEVINAALSRYAMNEDPARVTYGSIGTADSRIVLQGTSMASPHIAGAVALLFQKNGTLTTDQLKGALIGTNTTANTTVDAFTEFVHGAALNNAAHADVPAETDLSYGAGVSGNANLPAWNNRWGYGKANFAKAVAVVTSTAPSVPVSGTRTLTSTVANLYDGSTYLFVAPSPSGSPTRVISYGGTTEAPSISASRVRAASVRTRSTSPNATLWVRTETTEAKVGDIVPVQVGVTTGVRAIDGAQVALKAAPGTRFVDHDGNVVTSGSAFSASGVLPNILRQAVDVGRGLLQVALGRTFAASSSGVTGEGVLGTVYLEVTGPVSGDLVTIERTGASNFATMVAGDGDDLTGSLVGLSATVAVNAPVDPVSAPTASAPIIGGTGGTAYVAPAPASTSRQGAATSAGSSASAPSGSARASAPARSGASATSASARPAIATTRGLTEDRDRGTITVSVPGRAPIDLKTGTLAMAPDQYCPVLRHQTYVRLDDVGIAGATFGVEAGGVLSWVSPDQAGCVSWTAISEGGLTFTKETIMQFQLARAVPGALLWVLDGSRNGELYEVDANGIATYVTAEAFAADQDHFTKVWANVIPVSTAQVDGLASRGVVSR